MFCESDAKSYGCDIFHSTRVSCVPVSLLYLRTLSAGFLSLKQNGVCTLVITSGCTDCPLRTSLTELLFSSRLEKLVPYPVSKVALELSFFPPPKKKVPEPWLKLEPIPSTPLSLPDLCWSGIRGQTRNRYLGLPPPRLDKIGHMFAGKFLLHAMTRERLRTFALFVPSPPFVERFSCQVHVCVQTSCCHQVMP